ncbi:MAG: NAD-dependent epimerase/dehydratase family protein [bacterium]|nr:NAD-dependent epimerase/dehydratase family protein [bacterium]
MNDRSGPVLITGSCGFVGLHLVRDLLATGAEVVGVDLLGAALPLPDQVGGFERTGGDLSAPGGVRYTGEAGEFLYRPLDLADGPAVTSTLAALEPATVYHLAAQSSAAASFKDPAGTFTANLQGTLHLLEAVRSLPVDVRPAVLSVGSCEEYGPQPGEPRPLDEATPLNPISPYAVTKAAQSLLCRQYAASWGLHVVVARPFSHTGAGHDTRFAFPDFARQIAAAEVAGQGELATGDLSAVRDFLDVRDVTAAYRLLAAAGKPGEAYNVCSGSGLTIREGLNILLAGASCPVTVRTDPARCRPSDTPHLIGDGAKLRDATGWAPVHDIRDTLWGLLEAARKEFS